MAAKSNDKLRAAHAHIAARSPTIYSIPAASREWARKKFQHFSLSRYSDETRPANYIAPKHAKNVAVIQKANKVVMGRNIAHWPKETQGDAGLRLSLANKDLRALLPSYKPATGTIKMEELIAALKTHMTGTQFYSSGAPPLVRLAEQEQLRKSAQQFIQTIKDNAATARKSAANGAVSAKKPPASAPRKRSVRP